MQIVDFLSFSEMGREIVYVKVGPGEVAFGVHKDLLCHYSPYFKAAFTSGFEETNAGVMKLPEISVELFEVFNRWLYHKTLWSPDDFPKEADDLLDERGCPLGNGLVNHMDILMRLYVFANMVRIPSLMNQILDDLNEISNLSGAIPTAAFSYVWDNVCDSSPIRRFIVDWVLWEVDEDTMDEDADEYPSYMRLEIMKAARRTIRGFSNREKPQNPKEGDMSCYYVPENNNNKERESSTKVSEGN